MGCISGYNVVTINRFRCCCCRRSRHRQSYVHCIVCAHFLLNEMCIMVMMMLNWGSNSLMGSLPFASSSIFLVDLSHIYSYKQLQPTINLSMFYRLCDYDCVPMSSPLYSLHHPCTIRIHTHTHTLDVMLFLLFLFFIPVWNYCWSCARMGMCTRFHMTSTTRWRQHIYGKWELSWWCSCCCCCGCSNCCRLPYRTLNARYVIHATFCQSCSSIRLRALEQPRMTGNCVRRIFKRYINHATVSLMFINNMKS